MCAHTCTHIHIHTRARIHTHTHTHTHTRTHTHVQEFAKLHSFLTSVQSSFFYFDKDRSRTLELSEVLQALKHAGEGIGVPDL